MFPTALPTTPDRAIRTPLGQLREEHLHDADHHAQQPGADERDTEECQHRIALTARDREADLHRHQRAQQHRHARERHRPGESMGEGRDGCDGRHQQQTQRHAVKPPARRQGATPRQPRDQQSEARERRQLVVERGRRRLVVGDQRCQRHTYQQSEKGQYLAVGLGDSGRKVGGGRRRGKRHERSGS
ncbi:hypothetical protein ACQ86G_08020 [Roseateles chitinivorans]|uniref:hypothetical protein n=1 Tax=Roseateles chitinivorans TaxID=2917965 RepID=UPI003D67F898